MAIKSNEQLSEFFKDLANWIDWNSLINDDWLNTLKTYKNVTIPNNTMAAMNFLIMCMFIDLSIARFEGLLDGRKSVEMERAIIEHISWINALMSDNKELSEGEITKIVENTFYVLLKNYRAHQIKNDFTVSQNYLAHMLSTTKELGLPEDIWIDYIDERIKRFEKAEFRSKLGNILENSGMSKGRKEKDVFGYS